MPSVPLAQGLLDLAFDPKFTDNKFFYVSHTINTGTAVSQFKPFAGECLLHGVAEGFRHEDD